MIQLREDCFYLEDDEGRMIPCSADDLTVELLGGAAETLDKEWLRHAAAGVLHYFKNELGQDSISVKEFAAALSKVLNGTVLAAGPIQADPPPEARVEDIDLRILASQCDKAFELGFFNRLREAIRERVDRAPHLVRCDGLRGCVKQLTGRRRWCDQCRGVELQIVGFLQSCFSELAASRRMSLLIR